MGNQAMIEETLQEYFYNSKGNSKVRIKTRKNEEK
jgi:hypothetical protein